jgi:ethanolamine utilization protein EutP (predicted NTPase)
VITRFLIVFNVAAFAANLWLHFFAHQAHAYEVHRVQSAIQERDRKVIEAEKKEQNLLKSDIQSIVMSQAKQRFEKMLVEPKGINIMLRPAEAEIAVDYRRFFKSLGLAPDQYTQLKQLIALRSMSAKLSVNIPDAYKGIADIPEKIEFAGSSVDGQIKDLIGQNGFDALVTYQQQLPAIRLTNNFTKQLSANTASLNDTQENALIAAISKADLPQAPSFAAPDEEKEAYVTAKAASFASISNNVQGLDDTQRTALRDFMESQVQLDVLRYQVRARQDELHTNGNAPNTK